MNKLNDKNYIKFHLQELEGFSKFLKSRLNELDSYSNSFKSKYSRFFDLFKFFWDRKPFRASVMILGTLLLLLLLSFGITELFSVDHAQLNPAVSEQVEPKSIFGKFTLFLVRRTREAFYYLLSVCIVVGSVIVSLYIYRRIKGIPLDAAFLPHNSESGTQTHEAQNVGQATQTIEHETMPESLGLEGPLNQDHQNLIEPIQSNEPVSFSIIDYIEKSSSDERGRGEGIIKRFTFKRREASHLLMRQVGTLNDTNSPELEALLKKTLAELEQLDQDTLTELQSLSNNEIVLSDTAGDFNDSQ